MSFLARSACAVHRICIRRQSRRLLHVFDLSLDSEKMLYAQWSRNATYRMYPHLVEEAELPYLLLVVVTFFVLVTVFKVVLGLAVVVTFVVVVDLDVVFAVVVGETTAALTVALDVVVLFLVVVDVVLTVAVDVVVLFLVVADVVGFIVDVVVDLDVVVVLRTVLVVEEAFDVVDVVDFMVLEVVVAQQIPADRSQPAAQKSEVEPQYPYWLQQLPGLQVYPVVPPQEPSGDCVNGGWFVSSSQEVVLVFTGWPEAAPSKMSFIQVE